MYINILKLVYIHSKLLHVSANHVAISRQWRTEGGVGVFNPPEIPKAL